MKGFAPIACLILVALSGCRADGTAAPRLSGVSPAVVPTWAGGEVLVAGEGFFPVMGVSTSSGEAVVASSQFTVRLSPTRSLDAACTPEALTLTGVQWEGAGALRATLPTDACAAEYAVSVTDPRGNQTAEAVSLILSPVWPDHLLVAQGACSAPASLDRAEAVIAIDDASAFSVRVVGPNGEPASAFPAGLERAAPLAAQVTLVADPSDTLVGADVLAPSLAEQGRTGDELARFAGALSDLGCADLTLTGSAAGRLRLEASSVELPRRGEVDGSALDVLIQPAGDLILGIEVPEVVEAGVDFPVTVRLLNRGDSSPVGSGDACLDLRANDQDRIQIHQTSLTGGVGCASGWLPMVGGEWAGDVKLEVAEPRAFLMASTQYGVFGASAWFEVVYSDARVMELVAPSQLVVGQSFSFSGSLSDAYGNPVAVDAQALGIPSDESGSLSCHSLDIAGSTFTFSGCSLTRVVAANHISVTYEDVEGRTGPLTTLSGPAVTMALSLPGGSFVAGEAVSAEVRVIDAWGNLVDAATGQVDLSLQSGAAVSATSVQLKGGALTTKLTFFKAQTDLLKASFQAAAASAEVEVRPGAVDRLRVTGAVDPEIVAGTWVDLQVAAVDAWDNLTADYDPPSGLSVTDVDGATLMEDETVEFVDGRAAIMVQLTTARDDERLTVSDGRGHSGQLTGLKVIAGPLGRFAMVVTEGAAYFVDEAFTLEIQAEDAYGNAKPDFKGQVSYVNSTRSLTPAWSGPFEGGIRRERFIVGAADDADVITVSWEGEGGETVISRSAPFLVLNVCQGGMTVDLELVNLDDDERGTLCVQNRFGGTPLLAEAHTAGASSSVIKYIWNDGSSAPSFGISDSHTFSLSQPGYYPISVTAYELSNLCGVRDSQDVFFGETGAPTGPLALTSDRMILNAGYADGTERANLQVTGLDCAGERVSEAVDLTILSSYGDIKAIDTRPARPGTQTSMANGTASFGLSVGNEQQATIATVVAGAANGSCFGSIELEVRNDILNPWVVDFGPTGYKRGPAQTAWVRFSEPMKPESILYNDYVTVTLKGEGGRTLVRGQDFDLSLDDANTVLTFTFLPEGVGIDVGSGTVRINLPSEIGGFNVEDENGKRLDGNWDGILDPNDAFGFEFGDMQDTSRPTVLSCQPDPILYTPSQYDSLQGSDEGIRIALSMADDLELRTWRLEVYDLQGITLYEKYGNVSTDGDPRAVESQAVWHAASMDGPVVPNGTYWFEVSAIDGSGNLSEGVCQGWVEIANPLDLSPL